MPEWPTLKWHYQDCLFAISAGDAASSLFRRPWNWEHNDYGSIRNRQTTSLLVEAERTASFAAGLRSKSHEARYTSMNKVNLREKLALFTDHWNPRIVGELNGQHVKLV